MRLTFNIVIKIPRGQTNVALFGVRPDAHGATSRSFNEGIGSHVNQELWDYIAKQKMHKSQFS